MELLIYNYLTRTADCAHRNYFKFAMNQSLLKSLLKTGRALETRRTQPTVWSQWRTLGFIEVSTWWWREEERKNDRLRGSLHM